MPSDMVHVILACLLLSTLRLGGGIGGGGLVAVQRQQTISQKGVDVKREPTFAKVTERS